MKRCVECLQPDRPNLYFNDEDICGACLWAKEKETVDWKKRETELKKIAEDAKALARERHTYDCAIGVSGGKDSTFQALYARDNLGLNCLLVSNIPDGFTNIGRKNLENLIQHGFDCVMTRVNPVLQRELAKRDFLADANTTRTLEYPLWASVYTVAAEKNIPLVIQGENPALTLGLSLGMEKNDDAGKIYNQTTTFNGQAALERYKDIEPQRLLMYLPKQYNGRAIWLQYYVREWSQTGNAQFAIDHGLKVRKDDLHNLGLIHNYASTDTDFFLVNQMIKYYKLGFSYATQEVGYEIREKGLSKEAGIKLITEYDGLCGRKYIKRFCKWLGISGNLFWGTIAKFKKYDPWGRWEQLNGNRP